MKTIVALVLICFGLAIGLVGIGLALKPVAEMYQQAIDDPLADSDEGEDVRDKMLVGVFVGAGGVPPLVIGTVLLKRSRRRSSLS
ncbi:MAG: hypothetical protein KDA28_17230 [Phycisphaerales bacterium]|nr:hypothetical protein [Phycisphaerales bacterium]